jgi:penicillin-binding protein 1C
LQTPFLAPHLAQKLFAENRGTGLIRTTIDSELQQNLEEFAHNQLAHLPPQATLAIVVAEKKDASVRAYIGNADFYDVEKSGSGRSCASLEIAGFDIKAISLRSGA